MKTSNKFKLEMLILAILKHRDCYGYEITVLITKTTQGRIAVKEGTIYPILFRLIESKQLTSYKREFNNKLRIYYHIEPAGEEALEFLLEDFRIKVEGIDKIVKGEFIEYEQ